MNPVVSASSTISIPSESLNWLKAIFEQDINIINVLVKNYNSIMTYEKFDKTYLDELANALKLVEANYNSNSESQNQLSKIMEQTMNSLKIVSATQNSYVNEFTQKIIPSLKAFKNEVLEKKVNVNTFSKIQDNKIKKTLQRDNETNFEKSQKFGKELQNCQQAYDEELNKLIDNITSYSSDRAMEYKALFLHMIFYSMEMHTKCLEELTNLNSFVENFDPEEYEKELTEYLLQDKLLNKKE